MRSLSRVLLVGITTAAVLAGGQVGAEASGLFPQPGAHGGGERLYPGLGNGGYDVLSYDVSYKFDSGTPLMPAAVSIVARADQSLSSFSLDAVARKISSVSVNGLPANFVLDKTKEKLVIDPKLPLLKGLPFRVGIDFVADRSLSPKAPNFGHQDNLPHWVNGSDGFWLLGQPDRAHLFFPMNDVPRDKARVTFRINVPRDRQAVASGLLKSKVTSGNRTTYVYSTRDPIPTDVVEVGVGRLTEIDGVGPHGLPLRSFVSSSQAAAARRRVGLIPGQLRWVEKKIGAPYPFETYGVLGEDADVGIALEGATLTSIGASYLAKPSVKGVAVMVHELVHQYFGNAVSVRSWDDMWISEGHASYYGSLWSAEQGDDPIEEFLRKAYDYDSGDRPLYGPPGRPADTIAVLGGTNAGGALMLYGLNRTVGDKTFTNIERTFFQRYRNRSATTQNYIDVVNQVTGKDFTKYIRSWIYGKTTPMVPGHPELGHSALRSH
ncbi:M1 family metallopeptidase [Kribbella sp. NPDC051587]|uniref:M1 family metallopeptidase n=1 Tax=Kribbella sp. NPDC051587 TaxID=3364119 RepID=UPI00379B63AF